MHQRLQTVGALALVRIAGHQQDHKIGELRRGGEGERDAVHQRHADIGQQQVVGAPVALEHLQGLGAVARLGHSMAVDLESPAHEGADRLVVLGDENPRHRLSPR